MNLQEIEKIYKLELSQKLEIIEKIISGCTTEVTDKTPVNPNKVSIKRNNRPFVPCLTPRRSFICILAIILIHFASNTFAQTKAIESIVIGRIIDSTKGGGNGIRLLDGTRIKARIINIGTAASDSAMGHGSYGSDALGGPFNGNNDESDSSPGSPGLTLSGYLGDKTPVNFTRITSTPRDSIDNGEATDFANATGFHIWTEGNKPIRIKQLLLIDADGASFADNREWFTVFAFNDTARIYPSFNVSTSPSAKLSVVNENVSLNWYNIAKDSIPGIDTIRTALIVKNSFIGPSGDYSGDPDNINTQALADFGSQIVTDYFVLWGIREDVPTGGTQNSGLSPLVFEYEFDFGDAPNSYGCDLSSNGPYHVLPNNGIAPQITLGDSVTFDVDGMPGILANGDWDDGVYAIDTIDVDTSILSKSITTYTLRAKMENNSGKTAKAIAWIDWNNNGLFETGEAATDSIVSTTTYDTLVFTWSGVTLTRSATSDLATYARIRLTTESITTSDASNKIFQDGEVEDYVIPFSQILYDYDDAPDSYGTLKASNGPAHVYTTDLTLGSGITVDSNGIPGALANGDTDDGVSAVSSIYLADSLISGSALDYTLTTQFVNNTGEAANFAAWIDWNNNGAFETTEAVLQSTLATDTSGVVSFTWVSPTLTRADTTDKTTYARIRVSTNVISSSDFNNSIFQNGEVESYLINIQKTSALPLDILSFEAIEKTNEVLLKWEATETNLISQFEILRSPNGRDFKSIGQIESFNNQSKYSYIDKAPFQNLNLYRLKFTDKNGQIHYSPKTISIRINKTQTLPEIFPNPAQNILIIGNIINDQPIQVILYNNDGKIEINKFLSNNDNYIDVSNLKAGNYYLKAFDGQKKILSEKIQITK